MMSPTKEFDATDVNLAQLKQHIPLLEYLQRRNPNWKARRVGNQLEFVGLCPLHRETNPSFYVNSHKNLFYCHGCGRGGDLIRFVQLSLHLSFPQALAHLRQQLTPTANSDLLERTAAFYQLALHRHPEAVQYLAQRGLHDPAVIEKLAIGYAPGGVLRRHLCALGYPLEALLQTGLLDAGGRDAFCRRVIFPCRQHGKIVNLYGRSIGAAFPHRLLPHSRGGLFAWDSVARHSAIILVEGLFDLAVLWQAGFHNTTCAFGTHLTPAQWVQLSHCPGRLVYIAFDQDANQAGPQAARDLARRLRGAGSAARLVCLPQGFDPNSYFVQGAVARDFATCLEQAQPL
jgi:DNA primase